MKKANKRELKAIARAIAVEEVEFTGTRDLLTGIWNAKGFIQAAEQIISEIAPKEEYAIVHFGIDRFWHINQTYGSAVGDDILKGVADALAKRCGEGEACGRIDKDNFALLIKTTPERPADRWMREIERELISPWLQKQLQGSLSFSGGIYPATPRSGEDVKTMLERAMLTQKWNAESGHSGYLYFDRETYGWELYCASLLEHAPQAILNGEFKLYIQPQVDLATGRTVSGEALVRWRQPDGTLVMPGDFIPLFEKSELIIEFDFYMLDLLCRQLRAWLDAGAEPVPVSINQSRRHIHRPDYAERFCGVVDRYGIPHRLLVFELTESAFVEGDVAATALAEELHRLGFQLAIDDFGTGYAALNLLKIEADILKIDKSLLADVGSVWPSQVILRKVVEMAKEIGMTVVCEGIEDKQQLDYLRGLHCDIGQGFYFHRPIPAENFLKKLKHKGYALSVRCDDDDRRVCWAATP